MFISNEIKIGSIQVLNKDVNVLKGTCKKGSKVKITGISERGYDFIDLESNEQFIEVSSFWDNIPVFK